MSETEAFPPHEISKEISVLKKQLTIALKFHHSQTIEKLPQETALQAMKEVWESCHPEATTHTPKAPHHHTTDRAPIPSLCDDVPVTKAGTIYL